MVFDKKKTEKPAIKRNPRSPGSLDAHFGKKLRARRRIMVPTFIKTELAKALGITFQQVRMQKGQTA